METFSYIHTKRMFPNKNNIINVVSWKLLFIDGICSWYSSRDEINKTVIYFSSFTNFHICCIAVLLIFQTKPSFPAIQKISHLINCGYLSMINYYFLVFTRTTKLHRCPIQKFNAKMMRLIYIICSKNLTNKGFHIFFANEGNC